MTVAAEHKRGGLFGARDRPQLSSQIELCRRGNLGQPRRNAMHVQLYPQVLNTVCAVPPDRNHHRLFCRSQEWQCVRQGADGLRRTVPREGNRFAHNLWRTGRRR